MRWLTPFALCFLRRLGKVQTSKTELSVSWRQLAISSRTRWPLAFLTALSHFGSRPFLAQTSLCSRGRGGGIVVVKQSFRRCQLFLSVSAPILHGEESTMGSGGQDPAGSVADGVAWSPSSIQPCGRSRTHSPLRMLRKTRRRPRGRRRSIQVRLRRHQGCLCLQRRRRKPPASEL